MLWKASEAVPEGNDPVPQKEELGSGQPTMEDVYRPCCINTVTLGETQSSVNKRLETKVQRLELYKRLNRALLLRKNMTLRYSISGVTNPYSIIVVP